MSELVSITTPTFPGREDSLFDRAIPSVYNLDWPNVEMVIVSDRNPDLDFASRLQDLAEGWPARKDKKRSLRWAFINETWRNPLSEASIGAIPWHTACLMALGEFVGHLGDDDEYLPDHVTRHVQAMKEQEALFSVSQVEFRAGNVPQFLVGSPDMGHGHLDAIGVMCHISALQVVSWTANGENAADYRLVRDWKTAGLKGVFVGEGHTAVHHEGWLTGNTGRPDRPQ